MSLFNIQPKSISFPRTLENIPEFRKVLEHKNAENYMLYIHHTCDYDSPYASQPDEIRIKAVQEDFLDGKEPDKVLKAAVDKYMSLFETDSVKLITSARKAVFKLRQYFEEADPAISDDPGKSAKDLMTNLKSVGDIMKKLKEWEESIKKERDTSTIRKGVEINEFNAGQ